MKLFPVLTPSGKDRERLQAAGIKRVETVPWAMVAPHAELAAFNHGDQSLERLAERGGLDAGELVAVLRGWRMQMLPVEAAHRELGKEIERWLHVLPGQAEESKS